MATEFFQSLASWCTDIKEILYQQTHEMRLSSVLLATFASQTAAWTDAFRSNNVEFQPSIRGHMHMAGQDDAIDIADFNTTGQAFFTQTIDHSDPSKGTFEQMFLWSSEFWGGPGSPVIMFTPGEVNGSLYTSYLSLNRTTGVLAQKIGAAIFVVEHRYWGESSPYSNLSTENLAYLTLENSILDFTNFASNVKLPWANDTASTGKDVPWVMMGGSYSGALSAWTESVAPGTFWAYHSSSAPVEAISNYAAYFYPIQEGMPQNCSKDISLVIDYMDTVLTSGNESAISDLKTMFNMASIEHNDDFMAALENGPWLWQNVNFLTGYSQFFEFCDYIEDANNTPSSPDGVGLEKALNGYAMWFSQIFLPDYCYDTYGYADFEAENSTACFDTYNASSPQFTDSSLSNTFDRQWNWFLCNEPFGYWQDGAPKDHPTLVSRLVDAEYWTRQCDLFFPPGPNGETFGLNKNRTEADVNAYTLGWQTRNTTRLAYTNGQYDPWRNSGVSSDIRPGGPMQSTEETPIFMVPGGIHVSDYSTRNGKANEGLQKVIDAEVAQLVQWVNEWPGYNKTDGSTEFS